MQEFVSDQSLKQKDLLPVFGSQGITSEVLRYLTAATEIKQFIEIADYQHQSPWLKFW